MPTTNPEVNTIVWVPFGCFSCKDCGKELGNAPLEALILKLDFNSATLAPVGVDGMTISGPTDLLFTTESACQTYIDEHDQGPDFPICQQCRDLSVETDAFELACEILGDDGYPCHTPDSDELPCPDGGISCAKCWAAFLRNKALKNGKRR